MNAGGVSRLDDSRLAQLFATPVLEYRWPDMEAVNTALREVILEHEESASGVHRSNAGGWHSTGDFERWSGEPGAELIRRVGEQINRATALYYQAHQGHEPMRWRITMWANVNRGGDFNRPHMHPGATWSGIYYVDPGDESDDDSGAFVLHHPNLAAVMTFFPSLTPQSHVVRPVAGQMIVFPSYLPHQVYPYRGQKPRISVAFNAKAEALDGNTAGTPRPQD